MEVALGFFIFITIFIDSLSLVVKSLPIKKRLPVAYVVSQALGYITRFSLFFILPLIGLILDNKINFNPNLFVISMMVMLSFHTIVYLFSFFYFQKRSSFLVYYFPYNLKYFLLHITLLFKNIEFKFLPYKGTSPELMVYFVSHIFLSLIFPLILMIGAEYPTLRATLMGVTSVYTGIFSIYIVFIVERKIARLNPGDRSEYIKALIFHKCISTFIASMILLTFFLYSQQ
jgi:hypothetical protein